MKHILVVALFVTIGLRSSFAQINGYYVQLTDKKYSEYSADQPGRFLSQRSIDRRERQNIAVTEQDLPVSPFYTDSLKELGIEIRYSSKWLNGVIAFSSDVALMDTLDRLSFVESVEWTYTKGASSAAGKLPVSDLILKSEFNEETYQNAWNQIRTVNGHLLHKKGFTGEGMQIAVIDAGFSAVDHLPAFEALWNSNKILGTKDFVDPELNIFDQHWHGMKVFSIMGGRMEGTYLGTAPDAAYWLLRTEDSSSETPIEADYFIAALEYADSAGVDVVNASFGYYEFDAPFSDYDYQTLDGSSRASRAASMAADKGMLVVVSAGNEGDKPWYYIGVPADAENILSVGAMSVDSVKAVFSSFGPSYDGRIKPEIAAMGSSVAVQSLNGGIEWGSGTSYSSPVIAGLSACLWQALPEYSAKEIRELIIKSANQYSDPDNLFGYGIPDFNWAVRTDVNETEQRLVQWKVGPNPFSDAIQLVLEGDIYSAGGITVSVFDVSGNQMLSKAFVARRQISVNGLSVLPAGLYILEIQYDGEQQYFKILKR